MSDRAPRKPYEAPRLVVSGTLLDLTQGSANNSSPDNVNMGSAAST